MEEKKKMETDDRRRRSREEGEKVKILREPIKTEEGQQHQLQQWQRKLERKRIVPCRVLTYLFPLHNFIELYCLIPPAGSDRRVMAGG